MLPTSPKHDVAAAKLHLNVVYKPGPEMYISDTLSRAALNKQVPNEPGLSSTCCEHRRQLRGCVLIHRSSTTPHVTDASLLKIVNETKADVTLQELTKIVLTGWPERKEDVLLSVREYWPFRDELNIQKGVLFSGQCVIIPKH